MLQSTWDHFLGKAFALFLILFITVLAIGLLSTDSHAYQRYNDGCQGCHGAFTDSTSPKGTVFPGGNKHEMHRSASYMATACNLCHTSGGYTNPYIGSSTGATGVTGIGCAGCHDGPGLRAHHKVNGVTVCSPCHTTDGTPPGENVNPPYYGTSYTKANNSCNSVAQANINENWSTGDFKGLDNDGDNLYDMDDPDCQTVTAGSLSVSPAGGLTSTGNAGGPFSPSSQSYTLTNPGGSSISWTASNAQSWATTSPASGTLAAGGTATVAVSVNSGANSLAAGSYSDTVTFTNTTNGTGNTTRPVSLTVSSAPAAGAITVFPEDNAANVPVNTVVSATNGGSDIHDIFNENTFKLTLPTGSDSSKMNATSSGMSCITNGIVQGTIAYKDSGTTAVFTPNCPLGFDTAYTATIAAGGSLAAPKVWKFTTIEESVDSDDDGCPDNEDDHPNDHGKATPPNPKGHGKWDIDVSSNPGAYLREVTATSDTSARINQSGRSTGYEFKDGVVSYKIGGVPVGGTVSVTISPPSGIPAGSKVYRADSLGFHEEGGAVIHGNTITLALTDGGPGDGDGVANGVVTDPIGVASPAASSGGSIELAKEGSSGGGCAVAAGRGSGAPGIDGLLVLAPIGLLVWRFRTRRHRR